MKGFNFEVDTKTDVAIRFLLSFIFTIAILATFFVCLGEVVNMDWDKSEIIMKHSILVGLVVR